MRYSNDRPPIFTLTSGPVNAYPEVLQGLGRPVLYDYDPAFQAFYERVVEKAQTAMRQTRLLYPSIVRPLFRRSARKRRGSTEKPRTRLLLSLHSRT